MLSEPTFSLGALRSIYSKQIILVVHAPLLSINIPVLTGFAKKSDLICTHNKTSNSRAMKQA